MIFTTCKHCNERVWRFQSGHKWYSRNDSAMCDQSPIGLHQWDGTSREYATMTEGLDPYAGTNSALAGMGADPLTDNERAYLNTR